MQRLESKLNTAEERTGLLFRETAQDASSNRDEAGEPERI